MSEWCRLRRMLWRRELKALHREKSSAICVCASTATVGRECNRVTLYLNGCIYMHIRDMNKFTQILNLKYSFINKLNA